jgi:LmbE family N-acetylglucosaminyl deacetylase
MSDAFVCVLAHPNDESFLAGGVIASFAAMGRRVGLVCATRGQRGKTGGLCSIEELPQVREGELREAARILGVSDLDLLPFNDQHLAEAPVEEALRRIVRMIRRLRPATVFTFDPEGANNHTDHIAISRFAMDGVAAAADARWYPEEGEAWEVERVLWPATVRVWEIGVLENAAAQPGVDYLIDVSQYHEIKEAALRAHRTQWPGLSKLFLGNPNATSWEAFRIGWGPRPPVVPANALP